MAMRHLILALASLTLLASPPTHAGRGSTPSAGASRSSVSRNPSSAPAGASTWSRSETPSYRPATSPTAARATPGARQLGTARRSLLDDGPPPSPALSQVIRDKERSGPGWLGTAVLVSMLSQHNWSSRDRQWLESKLATLKADTGDAAPPLAPALTAPIQFHYEGLLPTFAVGHLATIRVSAVDRQGQTRPVICELSQATVKPQGTSAAIQWQPAMPAVSVLTCHADGQRDRRILKAA
jgi:hypothetical protein